MTTTHPLADLCRRICAALQAPFNGSVTISKPIRPGACPEERADRLRQWCAENCVGRWRPLERWKKGAVRIEFEDRTDALWYWLSN